MIIPTIILRTSDFDYFKQNDHEDGHCENHDDYWKTLNQNGKIQKLIKKQKKINKERSSKPIKDGKKDKNEPNSYC